MFWYCPTLYIFNCIQLYTVKYSVRAKFSHEKGLDFGCFGILKLGNWYFEAIFGVIYSRDFYGANLAHVLF